MTPPLVIAETDRVRLIWSGPHRDVRDAREVVTVRPAPGRTVRLDGAERLTVPLRIDEETTQNVWLESLDGSPVALHHADPVLIAGLSLARGGTVVYGPVRFGSQAGRSRFTVTVGGMPELSVEVTVSPAKASWSDIEVMRADVEAAVSGAALAFVRPADAAVERAAGRASEPAWLALLRDETPRLERALASVARNPAAETSRALVTVRPSALRRASGETLRALRGTAVWPERVPGRPARPSLDTPAHRWLAAGLDAALRRASRLRASEQTKPLTLRRAAVVAEVERLESTLRRARRSEMFIGAGRPPAAAPRALRSRPDYADAADALAALTRSLALADGTDRAPAQDTSALYEAWASLAVVRALSGALGVDLPSRPFGGRFGRGAAHTVHLAGQGVSVEIVRSPRFSGPPALLVQIPDLLVTVRRPGVPDHVVVLDAKYRTDASGAAPPGDALGALHRYRDAIVGPDGRALVRTAAVLFPARPGANFETSRVWQSLGAIGVGAVPLLPGATDWLDCFAERLVSDPATGGGADGPC